MSENIHSCHIISLGAGVQSSTMALMAAHGEITPMPHCAIFADTQAEPSNVYRWLTWLEGRLPFPVYRVSHGNLEADTLKVNQRKDGKGEWVLSGIPYFTTNPNGQNQRQCTSNYKVLPLIRKVKQLIGENGVARAISWIGISLDEVHRMKPSRDPKVENRWPLIEQKISRYDCLRWMEAKGYPEPPKSACFFCPYHSHRQWREMRANQPEDFAHAAEFERELTRIKSRTLGRPHNIFLHQHRVPLDQVDFSTDYDRGQMSLFGNE